MVQLLLVIHVELGGAEYGTELRRGEGARWEFLEVFLAGGADFGRRSGGLSWRVGACENSERLSYGLPSARQSSSPFSSMGVPPSVPSVSALLLSPSLPSSSVQALGVSTASS